MPLVEDVDLLLVSKYSQDQLRSLVRKYSSILIVNRREIAALKHHIDLVLVLNPSCSILTEGDPKRGKSNNNMSRTCVRRVLLSLLNPPRPF